MAKNKPYDSFPRWDEVEKEIFTPEEIAAADLKVALLGEIIAARKQKGISQKKLEELSGVRQPIIARMEAGTTSPNLNTVLKLLAALGKTLYIGNIESRPMQVAEPFN